MPRIARGLVNGFIYHVINRGNGRHEVFHKDQDYKSFINIMTEAQSRALLKVLAYCIMPNHFHMLLMPNKGRDLSRWMQWLLTSHVRRYHRHYRSSGHVWQGRFKSFIVQKDDHLLTAIRYIERNPVRAGLVVSAKDWRWSSHRGRSGFNSGLLLSELPIELPRNWQDYVDTPLTDKELEKIRQCVKRQSPYGDPDWQKNICMKFGLMSTLNHRGRPRKQGKK
jgi:putative transposase